METLSIIYIFKSDGFCSFLATVLPQLVKSIQKVKADIWFFGINTTTTKFTFPVLLSGVYSSFGSITEGSRSETRTISTPSLLVGCSFA